MTSRGSSVIDSLQHSVYAVYAEFQIDEASSRPSSDAAAVGFHGTMANPPKQCGECTRSMSVWRLAQ
ncbi:hypothetical protein CFAM422_010254 [Trichoderma lentiforme]|uniref:Uncharacterized protein n=1 Tax=Trichoderma lentiforme TaxID=1567552 RepID=A0A9P4X989_9HYPO|nr:hypothetical protein CFAM422_010254 [Trichoderma lentiforme]